MFSSEGDNTAYIVKQVITTSLELLRQILHGELSMTQRATAFKICHPIGSTSQTMLLPVNMFNIR